MTRKTRSSKKLNQEETESSNSNNRQESSNVDENENNGVKVKESVSKITKEFILTNRKHKKIKKMQQKNIQFRIKTNAKKFKGVNS
jgi:hypothetical protein